MTANKADIEEFLKVVDDVTEETAVYYLEMCGGNCKEAINLYYELHTQGPPEKDNETMGTTTSTDQRTQSIHGPSTNSNPNRNPNPNPNRNPNRNPSSNSKLNINPNEYEDFVRAPDRHFNQALIHDMDEANFLYYTKEANKKNTSPVDLTEEDTFGKMFAPPENIICKLNFEETRKKAKKENKFILVHIQNSDFDSMRLNRDIWKDDTIQQILSDFFIFWLRHETDHEAMTFMHTYKVNKLPHICALCKRTGRQLKVWNLKQFEDTICAQSQLYEFVENAERKYSREEAQAIRKAETKEETKAETKEETKEETDSNFTVHKNSSKHIITDIASKKLINSSARSITKKSKKHPDDMYDITKDKDFTNYRAQKLHKTENKNVENKNKNKNKNEENNNNNEINVTKGIKKATNQTTSSITDNAATSITKIEKNVTYEKTLEKIPLVDDNKLYNNINNELSELHKLRLERMKKK